jgi:hypothetical protein
MSRLSFLSARTIATATPAVGNEWEASSCES